jgi:hypothetical protein
MVGHKLVPTVTVKLLMITRVFLMQYQLMALANQVVSSTMMDMEMNLVVSVFMASRLKMVGHKMVPTLTAKLLMLIDWVLCCNVK